ncbi:MAG: hypothetical protein IPG76_21995 [Acidobacteria bacterium]|nr:hypothetical protein [Acidobacteriota bacterium]
MKIRFVRTIGLREGEAFTDTQPINDKQFSFTITPKIITKEDVTFDFVARYVDKVLLEMKSVTANNYESVILKGGRAVLSVCANSRGRTVRGRARESRALLVSLTQA